MPIIKKKEPVEEIFFNELEDIISYNMKQMEHCLTTIGKRMCAEQDEDLEKKTGRTIIESTILKECMLCREKDKCRLTLDDRDKLGEAGRPQCAEYPLCLQMPAGEGVGGRDQYDL